MHKTLFWTLIFQLLFKVVSSQCLSSLSFQTQNAKAASTPLFQHYLTAKRDTAPSKPYLYVAAKETGLIIYNISNLSNPNTVTTIAVSSFSNLDVNNITQSGNYLFLALGDIFSSSAQKSGMAIVDVSNPAVPLVKSVYTYSANSGAGCVAIDGNYAYLAAMQNGIIVLDISNKSNIQFVSKLKPNINFPVNNPSSSDILKINARSMVVKNNVLYLCYDAGGVRIINTSNKSSLKESGRYVNSLLLSRARAYNNLVLNDTLIYVAADYCGMEVLNVKDTANIKRIGWWNPWKCETTSNTWLNSPGHTNEIEFDANCKMVFMSAGKSDLMAVSVANPSMPDSCSQFGLKTDSAGTWGLGKYQNQIYLAYISTWPLFVPFRSEWSGIKILTYNNACSTGLLEEIKNNSIKIFPNPANAQLRISADFEPKANLQVFDYCGNIIFSTILEEGQLDYFLNTSIYNQGIYCLKIRGNKVDYSAKFIVQHQ